MLLSITCTIFTTLIITIIVMSRTTITDIITARINHNPILILKLILHAHFYCISYIIIFTICIMYYISITTTESENLALQIQGCFGLVEVGSVISLAGRIAVGLSVNMVYQLQSEGVY